MNLIDLLRGILTGYAVRFLQVVASLVVVPFVLRPEVLGIAVYGRIFSIIASLGLVNMLTDGLRVSYSRSIAQALSISEECAAECLGSGLKAMFLLVVAAAVPLFYCRSALLDLLGIPNTIDWMNTIEFAIAQVLIDNLLYVFQSYALARGQLNFVNQVFAVEVIARNAAIIAIFSLSEASPAAYMAILAAGTLCRGMGFAARGFQYLRGDLRTMLRASLRQSFTTIRYSFSVSMSSLQYFIVQHLSIPLVNKWIGPAEAGLLSIGLKTIATNVSQVLFSVVRPILVPLVARIRFGSLSAEARRIVLDLDALYMVAVITFATLLVGAMPLFISLWLGSSYAELVVPAQILVAGSSMAVSMNVRRAILVAQGFAGSIARASMALAPVSLIAVAFAACWLSNWKVVACVVAAITAINAILAHGLVYERHILLDGDRRRSVGRAAFSVSTCLLVAGWLGVSAGSSVGLHLAVGLLNAGLVVAVCHSLILPIPRVRELLEKLRQSARSPIFAADTRDVR